MTRTSLTAQRPRVNTVTVAESPGRSATRSIAGVAFRRKPGGDDVCFVPESRTLALRVRIERRNIERLKRIAGRRDVDVLVAGRTFTVLATRVLGGSH